jgi:hypothetical protein
LLQASAIAEKPLLDAAGARSLDLGLTTVDFNHQYLILMLSRRAPWPHPMRCQSIESSIKMLNLLQHLVSDSEEVYNGIIWQLVCCPFTAFLTLFNEIMLQGRDSHRGIGLEKKAEILAAMERLPDFLTEMAVHNSLARKLQGVAATILEHARLALGTSEDAATLSYVSSFDWNALLQQAVMDPASLGHVPAPEAEVSLANMTGHTIELSDQSTTTDVHDIDWLTFGDAMIDWSQL